MKGEHLTFYPCYYSFCYSRSCGVSFCLSRRYSSLSCATVPIVAMSKTHDTVEMRAADSDGSVDGYSGTSQDAKDMYRLGRSQELKVWHTLKSEDCTQ